MSIKKQVLQMETNSFPSIKMVLGDIPVPHPTQAFQPSGKPGKPDRSMESAVQRLIDHLKEKTVAR